MGVASHIEYRPNSKALKPPDYKTVWDRKDVYFCSFIQTQNGEDVHLINHNSTSSLKRAKKWLRLYKRRFLYDYYKSYGIISLIKFLIG